MVSVSIIGIGYWGSKVYEEYAELKNEGVISEVVACDLDEDNFSTVNNDDVTTTSLDEAITRTDIMHVCTNNQSHFDMASKALKAGNDVLIEKPLTVNRSEAYDLVELASERGQILQTGHIFRFADVVRRVKELYQNGFFGEVYNIDLRWTHQIEPRSDTNVLWDLLPHPIDIINFIIGSWPSEAKGYADYIRAETVDQANIVMKIDGITTTTTVSWVNQNKQRILEIVGSEGSIRAECVSQHLNIYRDQEIESEQFDNNTIRREIQNFITASKTGENKFNSAIVGARAVDAIEMISESIEYE